MRFERLQFGGIIGTLHRKLPRCATHTQSVVTIWVSNTPFVALLRADNRVRSAVTKRKGRGFAGNRRDEKEKLQYESIASDAKGPGPQRCMGLRFSCVCSVCRCSGTVSFASVSGTEPDPACRGLAGASARVGIRDRPVLGRARGGLDAGGRWNKLRSACSVVGFQLSRACGSYAQNES